MHQLLADHMPPTLVLSMPQWEGFSCEVWSQETGHSLHCFQKEADTPQYMWNEVNIMHECCECMQNFPLDTYHTNNSNHTSSQVNNLICNNLNNRQNNISILATSKLAPLSLISFILCIIHELFHDTSPGSSDKFLLHEFQLIKNRITVGMGKNCCRNKPVLKVHKRGQNLAVINKCKRECH